MNHSVINTVVSAFRNTLIGTPLFRPIRFAYQAIFNRRELVKRRARRKFFSQFIKPGDLVFDVGANIGDYSQIMWSLGARVIAIEPDPRNVAKLRKRVNRKVVIEQCALGKEEGTANLNIASQRGCSTLSPEFVERTPAHWIGTVPVRISTLDAISKMYGIPSYVKIDAESFDYEVLCGMSFAPVMVSFEYHLSNLKVAEKCIERLRQSRFNFVPEGRQAFELDHWVSAQEILERLSSSANRASYGDVFAMPTDRSDNIAAC